MNAPSINDRVIRVARSTPYDYETVRSILELADAYGIPEATAVEWLVRLGPGDTMHTFRLCYSR